MATRKKGAGTELADVLLDAHVGFVIGQMDGAALRARLDEALDALLADAARLKLKEVVTPAMVKATARRYAVELRLGPGLPELVGDIARKLHAHELHDQTRFGDLVSDARVAEFVDRALALRGLREKLVRELMAGPVYSAFVSDLLFYGIKGYLADNAFTRHVPGAASIVKLGKSVVNRATPRLEASVEEGLKKYLSRSIEATSRRSVEFLLQHLNDDAIRDMAQDVWSRLRTRRVSELRAEIGVVDLEKIAVGSYQYWHELRTTAYYTGLIEAGIDGFFEKYGSTSLAELLDELGVTREMMLEEALRYAPHAIKALKRKKLLEPWVRRLLEPFYRSPAFAAAVAAAR